MHEAYKSQLLLKHNVQIESIAAYGNSHLSMIILKPIFVILQIITLFWVLDKVIC